jgi:acetoin utilization deacetylase AcuC-like enzyme
MALVLVSSERFADHETPPGHPERPERAEIMDLVADDWRRRGGEVVAPRLATLEQVSRVHDPDYVRHIAGLTGLSRALDPDTYTSPESHEIALLAAGATVDAVERVLGGPGQRALALVRPPGHHAERDRAMGFCLYNNVAIATAHARAEGVGRVAIVDIDVHHGNGTQHMFEADPDILYLSLHQFPFYPGTGEAGEIGRGEGRGFTVNIPLAAGAVDEDYRLAFADVVVPVLGQFEPGLILVSAGFDAHERDPLGGMRLSTAAFAAMFAELRAVADASCQGRLAAVVEGGYDGRALSESLRGVVEVMAAPAADAAGRWPEPGDTSTARGRAAVRAVASAHKGTWTLALRT